MTDFEKLAWLLEHGLLVQARDMHMNSDFPGEYMISEWYETGHTQKDGSGGVWCIVGDDLGALICEAYDFWWSMTQEPEVK